jgi:hypothetical protein
VTDLDRVIQAARDDLEDVRVRLGDLYEHLYDPDWQPEAGRRSRSVCGSAPWTGPHSIQAAYTATLAELVRAQWALARGTDVPEHLSHRQPEQFASLDRAPTLSRSEAAWWRDVLDGMLRWCQGTLAASEPLHDRPERAEEAVWEACAHIGAARRHIDELWPASRPRRDPRCETCARRVEYVSAAGECEACRKYRDRNGRARPQHLWGAA